MPCTSFSYVLLERALQQVIFSIMADNMELFKQFQDNPSLSRNGCPTLYLT